VHAVIDEAARRPRPSPPRSRPSGRRSFHALLQSAGVRRRDRPSDQALLRGLRCRVCTGRPRRPVCAVGEGTRPCGGVPEIKFNGRSHPLSGRPGVPADPVGAWRASRWISGHGGRWRGGRWHCWGRWHGGGRHADARGLDGAGPISGIRFCSLGQPRSRYRAGLRRRSARRLSSGPPCCLVCLPLLPQAAETKAPADLRPSAGSARTTDSQGDADLKRPRRCGDPPAADVLGPPADRCGIGPRAGSSIRFALGRRSIPCDPRLP